MRWDDQIGESFWVELPWTNKTGYTARTLKIDETRTPSVAQLVLCAASTSTAVASKIDPCGDNELGEDSRPQLVLEREPNPDCRWCKGSGKLTLATSVVDCTDCWSSDPPTPVVTLNDNLRGSPETKENLSFLPLLLKTKARKMCPSCFSLQDGHFRAHIYDKNKILWECDGCHLGMNPREIREGLK